MSWSLFVSLSFFLREEYFSKLNPQDLDLNVHLLFQNISFHWNSSPSTYILQPLVFLLAPAQTSSSADWSGFTFPGRALSLNSSNWFRSNASSWVLDRERSIGLV